MKLVLSSDKREVQLIGPCQPGAGVCVRAQGALGEGPGSASGHRLHMAGGGACFSVSPASEGRASPGEGSVSTAQGGWKLSSGPQAGWGG